MTSLARPERGALLTFNETHPLNTFFQIIFPGFLVPFVLSLALTALTLRLRWEGACRIAVIWLTSYFWLRGLPSFPPRETVDWLWLIGIATLAAGVMPIVTRARWLLLSGLLAMSLGILAWPVIRHNATTLVFIELAVLIAIGSVLIHRLISGRYALFNALPMAIVSAGYGIVAALGGSLLVGLLSGALASALGGFALHELVSQRKEPLFFIRAALLANTLLLCLIFIGRVYAEIPSGPLSLLLVALVMDRLLPIRNRLQAVLISGIPTLVAVAWLVLAQDPSSYY